jgi:hypothetical protein
MTGTDFLFEVIFSQILEEKKPKQINVTGIYPFIKKNMQMKLKRNNSCIYVNSYLP